MLKVTYIQHSGFLVETDDSYLLMDYWKGTVPDLDPRKTLYIFASHAHHDHYSREIFKMENRCCKVYYILSSDIKGASRYWKQADHVIFMKPYEEKQAGGCRVRTLYSTDEGVAFLININGLSIYHAGDLHWWDWPGEPEADNIMYAEKYKAEIKKMEGERFHLAFVVLDPRQEESGGLGMEYFMRHVEADYIFPMHLWEDYDLIRHFKEEHADETAAGRIVEITGPGYAMDLE